MRNSSQRRVLAWLLVSAGISGYVVVGRATADAEYRVSSAADIGRLAGTVRPGDVLVMADGTWKDQAIVLKGHGARDAPITLRAQTPGKVILTGGSSLVIDGEFLVVSGLHLEHAASSGDGVRITGRRCRLTNTAIVDCAYKFYTRVFGVENRLDHCYLAGKANDSPTLQIEAEGTPNHHRIDHNHFGPRPLLGRNGGETIRVGYSGQSMSDSGTIVEHNLFDRCDGEIEIISNKSCGNVYRFNTFLDCAGMFTLRHGNRCLVESNFFLGRHKKGSGGVRVIGEDHIILNNYIEGVERGGFWVTAGIPDSPLNGYFRARNCLIAFNTIVDSTGPCVELDVGFGSSGRTLRPENVTIVNNLFLVSPAGALVKGTEGDGFRWSGNVAWPLSAGTGHAGVRNVDPRVERTPDGLLRPRSDSPVKGAAEDGFSAVKIDIDGQDRGDRRDVGCDQLSADKVVNRPLTAAHVGTSWARR